MRSTDCDQTVKEKQRKTHENSAGPNSFKLSHQEQLSKVKRVFAQIEPQPRDQSEPNISLTQNTPMTNLPTSHDLFARFVGKQNNLDWFTDTKA